MDRISIMYHTETRGEEASEIRLKVHIGSDKRRYWTLEFGKYPAELSVFFDSKGLDELREEVRKKNG